MKVFCINRTDSHHNYICKRIYNAITIFWYRQDCFLIIFFKKYKYHRKDGPAKIYTKYSNYFFYKNNYYGSQYTFTNKTWKEKIKELKREDKLGVFI